MHRQSAAFALVLVLGFVLGCGAQLFVPAHAQDPPKAHGQFQISTIPGAVYLLDTASGDVYVRNYTTKRWESAGNPLSEQH